ncbi:UV-B-induced protein At3g17800, chloroplastic-like isoform X2 [Macadamia integrifolia]|uniref:UV-B-induced protein At3g17800, chloroplastic-like isoform X2 n=1 Tax=Macadamia integrifolia TaxID=60698 RepID=UPI001C52BF70|nr:UV-B-induced protein At3g17800, chloroplastic-like isoform X2 [Macadamia integrifolia]
MTISPLQIRPIRQYLSNPSQSRALTANPPSPSLSLAVGCSHLSFVWMEAAAVLQSSYGFCKPSSFVVRSGHVAASVPDVVSLNTKFRFPNRLIKHSPSIALPNQGRKKSTFVRRKSILVMASSSSYESAEEATPIAPLELESPVGQFLSQILKSHPHLVPAAVDQQLKQLETDREAEKHKEEPSISGTDLVLYRRIAEVKANERTKALEEILYALVVQKFMDANLSLIPAISSPSSSNPSDRVYSWPSQEEKLAQLHSPEAYEMIKNHLTLILGNRVADPKTTAQMSKIRVGQVYAASVMYGYFLKRVDQRFQLEKTMKILPDGLNEERSYNGHAMAEDKGPSGIEVSPDSKHAEQEVSYGKFSPGGFGHGIKQSRLRTYVMSFDAETLQRYATIRSKEAISIIEKHTEALFGRPEIVITPQGTADSTKDELVRISFGGLKRLVLEALTFGAFLWDVESYVDSST